MPNSNLSKRLAREIRAEMARQSITPTAMARRTGISVNTFHRSYNGKRAFQIDELERITNELQMTISELLHEVNEESAA